MSRENVELIRRAVESFNGVGDLDPKAFAGYYHPDVEVRDLQHPPDVPETVRGFDAYVAALERWLDLFDRWSLEVHEYVDADPWVVCDTRWRGTGKGSEVEVEWRVADAHEIEGGRIVREIYGFPDVAAALEAVRAEGPGRGGHGALHLKP